MKGLLTKRVISAVLALLLCICVAGAALAVEGKAITTRVITVNTEVVISENYAGVGNNHWSSPYISGMNDAYQTVNEKRTNTIKPAYMRMLFLPDWLVDTSLSSEEQQREWESGIYHFDNIEVINFFQKVKMYKESGTDVILNMGARVDYDIMDWFPVKDAAHSEGGTRAAPANLEAFADATYAIFEYAWDNGYDNVNMLSWYNEVNGGNYEMYWDKPMYWCTMIKKTHEEFKSHTYKGVNARDKIKIFGTELSGFLGEESIDYWMEYVTENLVDENGDPVYDYYSCHHYPWTASYDEVLENVKNMGKKYPGVWTNEIGAITAGSKQTTHSGSETFVSNFKYSESAMVIMQSNAGYGGAACWVAGPDVAPSPMGINFDMGLMGMWTYPYKDMSVAHNFGFRSLMMRYIPKNSKVYKNTVLSSDILCAVYGIEEGDSIKDMTALLDVEANSAQRNLTIAFGSKAANKTFERHVYYYPDADSEGWEWADAKYEDGDLMPVTDKVLTADKNGNITDTLPANAHCMVVYTTLEEQVQILTNKQIVQLDKNGTYDFDVTEIYGTDDKNVTWSVYGKSRSDTNRGYNWTTENCGTIDQNGNYNATGTSSGDTVSIKITSNYDPTAYTVIIVEIQ